ncbi:hypothetical protein HNO93_004091, partial [Agrobacterium vitis]|nr:hypothetical protein [Agrobacterium vitis]
RGKVTFYETAKTRSIERVLCVYEPLNVLVAGASNHLNLLFRAAA